MNKQDTIDRLNKFSAQIKSQISAATPDKHKHRDKEYREFLARELEKINAKLESFKKVEG